jgi:FkbM family methyltransferase
MSSNKRLEFDEFHDIFMHASKLWDKRRLDLAALLSNGVVNLVGYGGKGGAMARQLRLSHGVDVRIFDQSSERLKLAEADGFEILGPDDSFGGNIGTILAACQHQREQKAFFPKNAIYFQEAAYFFDLPHVSNGAADFQKSVIQNARQLYDFYSQLDVRSREVFMSVLSFRCTGDPTCLWKHRSPVVEMWLDVPDLLKARSYKSVLDVGAYDGDTLLAFSKRFAPARALAVEANLDLLPAIKEAGTSYPFGVEIMPMAAWSSSARLSFEEVRFGMVRVLETEEGDLVAKPMDEFFDEEIDFLKMDIEGSEVQALLGAERLLKAHKPDLAIAAYHRPDDFFQISEAISNLGYADGSFTWHIGHYSDCLDDTIFYAIRSY